MLKNVGQSSLKTFFMVLGVLLLAGCASAPSNDHAAEQELKKINDPFENINRGIFSFNQILDKAIVKPITLVYRTITPKPLRKAIHNFLQNLKTPVIFANDLLQGEGERAANTVARFFINSTWGLLGFMDPAHDMGFTQHEEDFGQTLATWGSGEGPYVMLPLLGPSNPRDIVGRVLDFFIDPINWWSVTDSNEISIIRTGLGGIDVRNTYWEALEDIEKNSIDPYASYRSMYRQRRNDQIRNGAEMPTKSQSNLERELEISQPEIKDKS